MGVPSFYRWLIERYPLILQDAIEEEALDVKVPYENLYLDMNGIIHPCFHPEDRASPTTFSEVFQCMFDYIDRLFLMVRPRKLLFLAIDGVAPRAKMNQQRSRRFRAAKDAAEAAAEEERLRQEFESEGKRLPPKLDSQVFDSNVITPGTEFMSTLSFALQYYIHVRLNSDPGWKNIKVILSDANVPGEGEHKIMSYIRLQKNHPGYNPNACHCLYGLDADLIMLALATHEVHISILREVVFTPGQQDKCFLCGQLGHRAADCEGKTGDLSDKAESDVVAKKPYQFVNIWTLREYLEHDMQIPNSQLQKNLDRIIDDFIFICFFVGNDFLPHMPTLEIREGAIELLMSVYKKEFGSSTSYLSNGSKLNLKNVEHFIQAVGLYENNIFQRRAQNHQRQSERFSRDRAKSSRNCNYDPVVQLDSLVEVSDSLRPSLDDNTSVETEYNIQEEVDNREELKFKLKKLLREKSDGFISGKGEEDKVRLGVQGWRERYYEEKFIAKTIEEMEQIRRDVVLKYTEGLCWIMHYYYHGVCSWNWFYPYHYAPFASDLKFLDKLDIKFELGSPFKPFNQLLAVLPSASAHALPECFRKLMTDPSSPIAEFYPPDFEIDMNGKRYSWQGIAKLPFIEEQRLLDAAAKVEHSLTNEEVRRNSVLSDMLFVVSSHPLAELIRSLSSRTIKLSNKERAAVTEKIDPGLSEGMNGYLALCGGDSQPSCFSSPIEGMEDVLANQVICAIYKLPDDLRGSDIARPPPGVVLPKKTVQLADLKGGANLWHEDGDRRRAPAKIIKIKRYNPKGSISGDRLRKAAHRLVLQTISSQPDNTHINSEPALCPNTIFHNNQVSRNVPSPRGSAVQRKHPQSELALKKNRIHQSEVTEEEKTAIRKRKEKEKRGRYKANRRERAKNEQQANKGESNLDNKRPRSEVNEENRLEHKRPRFTEGKEQNTCAQSELTEEKNAKRKPTRLAGKKVTEPLRTISGNITLAAISIAALLIPEG
ncbi:BnaA06g37110D [Brassica napus]|uniref:5'-3' exoribonuclease n=1 Tax=Brassica napus TaxID=3708 RepID=A0A078GAI2_BRANA|nr:BnaA06g37110D [Brassica napus]